MREVVATMQVASMIPTAMQPTSACLIDFSQQWSSVVGRYLVLAWYMGNTIEMASFKLKNHQSSPLFEIHLEDAKFLSNCTLWCCFTSCFRCIDYIPHLFWWAFGPGLKPARIAAGEILFDIFAGNRRESCGLTMWRSANRSSTSCFVCFVPVKKKLWDDLCSM